MHGFKVTALNEVWCPSIPLEQRFQLAMGYAGEYRRVVDLVAIEMEDWENSTITDGIEELIAVPARSERTSLSLAVTDHGQSDEIRMVEDSAESVSDGVTELTTLVETTRLFRCSMTANSTRES